jgi:hypothetical protein
MISHIFSLITLVLIYKHLSNKNEWFSERSNIKRMVLIILSSVFTILYFICGIISLNKGLSIVSLFKMEYGLCFVYATYKLLMLNRAIDYQNKYSTETSFHSKGIKSEEDTIERLIKDTLICLEDDNFEKAFRLIDKADKRYAVDQNIVLLKQIVNQSVFKEDEDFSEFYCY